jgi:hypothetical protein
VIRNSPVARSNPLQRVSARCAADPAAESFTRGAVHPSHCARVAEHGVRGPEHVARSERGVEQPDSGGVESMTPEERERYRQRIRERWGFDPAAGESAEP